MRQAERSWMAVFRSVLTLAIPVAFQDLTMMFVNLIDNVMIGTLGEAVISGVSFTMQYVFLFSTLCTGLTSGAVVIGTQAWGKRDTDRVKRLFRMVLVLGLILSTGVMAVTVLCPKAVLRIYTEDETVIVAVTSYLKIIAVSMVPNTICRIVLSFLRITGNVRFGLYNSMVSCVVNAGLNWVLIFGRLGAPQLGVVGAAIATLIARLVEMIVSLLYFFKKEAKLQFRPRDFWGTTDWQLWKLLMVIGLPLLASEVINSLNSTVQSMIIGRVSTNFVAANSLVHNSYQIAQVFVRGFGSAAAILIGTAIGKGDREEIRRQSQCFVISAVMLGLISSAAVVVVTPILSMFYEITEDTRQIARVISYAASLSVFCVSIQEVVSKGMIKAGGRTKEQMRIDMISSWLIGFPVAYVIAFVWNAPPFWIYLGIRIPYFVKAIWGFWYIHRKDWYVEIA